MNKPHQQAPASQAGRAAGSPTGRRAVMIVLSLVIVGLLGYASFAAWQHRGGRSGHKHGAKAAAGPTSKQTDALTLDYPASTGRTPSSITTAYSDTQDRTTLTLRLTGLEVRAAGYALTGAELALISEFAGRARAADKGESSIDGVFSARSASPGALAGSEKLALFVSDGGEFEGRRATKQKDIYTTQAEPAGGVRERVVFKIDTKDLVALSKSERVRLRVGLAEASLNAEQIGDLREFAARLKPGFAP